jgi:UPF0755 protein
MKQAKIFWVFLALLLVGIVGSYGYYTYSLRPVSTDKNRVVFIINRGEGVSAVAKRLKDHGLIRSESVFKIFVYLHNKTQDIQAGRFELSPSLNVEEILNKLEKGKVDTWLTVIEGMRSEEIAQVLEDEFGLSKEEFINLSQGHEGKLFPDSYLIPPYFDNEDILALLLENFDKKTSDLPKQVDGLSQEEILILSSVVEREAKTNRDRRIVSGILIKRLKEGWPLQVDATSQYYKASLQYQLEGWQDNWWPKVVPADLKMENPYNTYLNSGLPPKPICNPSLSSIESVVNYQPSDYWYYISDSNGEHMYFAKTLEEHEANIQNYLR